MNIMTPAAIPGFNTTDIPTFYTTGTCTILMPTTSTNTCFRFQRKTLRPVRPRMPVKAMRHHISTALIAVTKPCRMATIRIFS